MPNYRKLIKRLAELFPTIDESRLILTYAEIDQGGISFNPAARTNWSNIIRYVEPRNKLEVLVQVAVDESDDPQLLEYIKEETQILPMKDASLYYKSELEQDLTELKKDLKSLVSKGKLEDVLKKLDGFADQMDSDDYKNTIVLLFSRLNRLQQEQRQGILSYENYNIEKNKITHSINYQIDQLSEQDVDRILTGLLPGSLSNITGVKVQDKKDFEKIMGGINDLVPVEWLHNAVERSRIVGKIELSNGGSGTGFLVKGGYVLTNHHVICKLFPYVETCSYDCKTSLDCPLEARLLLDYQASGKTVTYSLDPANGYYLNKELDYALIKIKDQSDNPISDWGHAEFETFGQVQVNDLINIIQHPEGGKKKIAMPDRVISNWKEKNYLFYLADTLEGSSGSPVFNQDWKVVALHHAGRSAVDGGLTINAAGDKRESNRGILIEAVIDDLNEKGVDIS